MSDQFYCEKCKGTFVKERSDDEAMKEFLDGPFYIPDEPLAVVCEECYQELIK